MLSFKVGDVARQLGVHRSQFIAASCLTEKGVPLLLELLKGRLISRMGIEDAHNVAVSVHSAMITRERHRLHLQETVEALEKFEGLNIIYNDYFTFLKGN